MHPKTILQKLTNLVSTFIRHFYFTYGKRKETSSFNIENGVEVVHLIGVSFLNFFGGGLCELLVLGAIYYCFAH